MSKWLEAAHMQADDNTARTRHVICDCQMYTDANKLLSFVVETLSSLLTVMLSSIDLLMSVLLESKKV